MKKMMTNSRSNDYHAKNTSPIMEPKRVTMKGDKTMSMVIYGLAGLDCGRKPVRYEIVCGYDCTVACLRYMASNLVKDYGADEVYAVDNTPIWASLYRKELHTVDGRVIFRDALNSEGIRLV